LEGARNDCEAFARFADLQKIDMIVTEHIAAGPVEIRRQGY